MQEKSKNTGWKEVNARATKTRRADVPWDPASDGDLMFEMTTMVILDPAAPGCPVHQIKVADQFKGLLDPSRPMNEATGRAMAEWAKGQGDAQAQKAVLDRARAAAREGREAFFAFYQSDEGKAQRPLIKTILEECQRLADQADEAREAEDSDDPFGLASEDTPSLTEDDEARILREIEEENQRAAEGA
jgi:hypothetical protein